MGEVKVEGYNMGLTFYRLTSLSFHVNQISHSWDTTFPKFDLKNPRSRSKLKVTSKYNTLSTHIPFFPCWSALPFLGYSYFKIRRWKFKVKVLGEVKVESQVSNIQLTFLSFHVNWASHSWVTTFSKFHLENQGSRSWVRSKFKVTMWV